MNRNTIYFLISIFYIIHLSFGNEDVPRVKTHLGEIKGFYKTSSKKQFYEAYEGIPYALPPTGNLRFEPPLPVKPWSQELDATKQPNRCVQYNKQLNQYMGDEDCLYLNVYTPRTKNATLLPVIVFIHGGGYESGYSINNQPTHLINRNVVFATMNYRLGPLGFLSTENEIVPGNMGLKDQSMALRWISENIQYFGGDPKRVTITGCSAGGSSVHYHYLSLMSAGLFQNGISTSGSVLSPWAYDKNPLSEAMKLAKFVKCPTDNIKEMVRCFKQTPAKDLSKATTDILLSEHFEFGVTRAVFQPTAEKGNKNYFINRSPREVMISKDVYDVPWVAGIVSAEGIAFTAGFILNETRLSYVDQNWKKVAPYLLMIDKVLPENKWAQITKVSRNYYLGNEKFKVNLKTAKGLTDLTGDKVIGHSVQEAVKLQAAVNQSPVQFYFFNFNGMRKFEKMGVFHCDDCAFILENDDFDASKDPEAAHMMERMLDFLYSVASGSNASLKNEWPKVDPKNEYLNYMHINGPNDITSRRSNNLAQKRFWDSLLN